MANRVDARGTGRLGAEPSQKHLSRNEFLYTGRRLDPETGLYQFRYRYYHAQLGRFLTWDLFGYRGGLNLYGYVGAVPTVFVDPLGLFPSSSRIDPYDPIWFGGGFNCARCHQTPNWANNIQCNWREPGGSNEDSWNELLNGLIPDEKGFVSACASMPIGAIPPFGVVTGSACAEGSIKKCKRKDGSLGAMLCGSITVSVSATFPPVPTAPGVTVANDPKNGGVHVFEKGTNKLGESYNKTCPQDKYFTEGAEVKTGGMYTHSTDNVPACETKTSGSISLNMKCEGGAIFGTGGVSQPIGSCQFPGGCQWGGTPQCYAEWAWTKPHASCSLTASGTITGCVNLSGK